MTSLLPAYRATLYAPRSVDPTEQTILTPQIPITGGVIPLPVINWLLQSQALATTPWSPSNLTAANNNGGTAAPDGTLTATTLTPNTTNTNLHWDLQNVTVTANEQLGLSGFFHSNGYTGVFFRMTDVSGTNYFGITFDTGTGASIQQFGGGGVVTGLNVVQLPNGWWWVSVSGTMGGNVTAGIAQILVFTNGANANLFTSYAGDGVSGILAWGQQLERNGAATLAPVFNNYVSTLATTGTAVFKVSTIENVIGFKPLMSMPQNLRRGRLDLLSKKTDGGEVSFDVLDVRATPGGATSTRFWTSFVGDAKGLPQLARCRCFVEESLDGGVTWAPFFTGRVKTSGLKGGSRTLAAFAIRDFSDDMTWTLFPGMPHAAVYARNVPGSTGQSSGTNTSTTINDTSKAFTTNQFVGLYIRLTGGTGAGQVRAIASNTGTQITVSTAWAITPDATTTYAVGGYAQLVSVMPVGFIYPYGNATATLPLTGKIALLDSTNGWAAITFDSSQVNIPQNQWNATLQSAVQYTPWGSPVTQPPTTTPTFNSPPTFTGMAVARVRRLDTNAEGDFLVGYGFVQQTQNQYGGFLPPQTTNAWLLTVRALSFPIGVATGTPTASGASAANPAALTQNVTTTGWTASITNILAQGDIISFANQAQRYLVQASVNSDVSGNATVSVAPGLAVALQGGEAITVQRSPQAMALPPLNTLVSISVVADIPLADGGQNTPIYNNQGIQTGTAPRPGNILLINDIHPAQLLQDVLSGYYGLIYRPRYDQTTGLPLVALDAGKNLGDPMWNIPFNQASFSAIIADQTFPTFRSIIDKTIPLRDFIEQYICKPYGLGYYFDASGNFVLVDLRERTNLTGVPTITDADLVDDTVPSYTYDPSQGISVGKITVYAEGLLGIPAYRLQQGDQFPTITSKMFDAQGGQVIDLSLGNIDLGLKEYQLDMKGYRAMPGESAAWTEYSGTLRFGSRWQYITQAAIRMAHAIASHPYGNGPTTITLPCNRLASNNAAAVFPGTWFMYQVSTLPAADTNLRGTTRLAICTERREDPSNGAKLDITGVDWGVAVISNPPTLAAPALLTGDGSHSCTDAVTLNAQGEPAETWISVQPAGTSTAASIPDSDPSWVYVGFNFVNWVQQARGLPAGAVIFWRARTIPKRPFAFLTFTLAMSTAKLPSAWVHAANGIALTGLSAVTGLATSGTIFSTRFTVAWTPPDTTHALEVRIAQGAVGTPWTFVATLPPGSKNFTFTKLAANTLYQVSVRVIDGVGGFAEATTNVTTAVATNPIIPPPIGNPIGFKPRTML